jgi:uncharacterized membrane protein
METGRSVIIWRLVEGGLDRFGRARTWLRAQGCAAALCAVVLCAGALRLYALEYQSLWSDEIFSLIVADPTLTFREFWDRVLADTHPPIYYLVLRLWSSLFGQSEFAARVPSALFGILAICAAATLPGWSLSKSARLALPLLTAASPGAAWYDREVRSYALLLLLSTIITLSCVHFLRIPPHEDRKARRAVAMLAAAAVLAAFTHYFGFLLAVAVFFTCFLLTARQYKPIVGLFGCSIAVPFIAWAIFHAQFTDPRLVAWIREFPIAATIDWFVFLAFGGTASFLLFAGTAGLLFASGGRRCFAEWAPSVWASLLVCLLILAAAAAISFHTAILTSRNMIVVVPALYVIAAELTASLVRRWGTIAGAIYLTAQVWLMSQPIAAYYTTPIKEQWRDSAALVLHTHGCEAAAIHVYGDAAKYRFFTKSAIPQLRLIEIPEGASADLGNEPVTSCPILLWIVGVSPRDLDDLLARSRVSRSSADIAEFHEAYVIRLKQPG